jgi:hypothetical protein
MGKWTKYNDFILENKDKSKSEIARMVYTQFGLDPSCFHAIRHHIKRLLNKYDNSAIEEYCEAMGIPAHRVDAYWHKGEYNGNDFSVRVSSEGSDDGISTEDIEDVVKSVLSDYKPVAVQSNDIAFENALKVVISDAHVGLEPNEDDESMFGYEYNKDIFFKNLDKVYDKVISYYKEHGTFELFILEDLGDLADGWNGYTTRGGHKLPQNMNNKEVFDACVEGRYKLIRRIVESGVAKKYIIRSVTNDNHSGDFSWMIHRTVEKMVELSLDANIETQILNKFVEHFYWGDHCFLVSHGKSKLHMKHGMPFHLNDKTVNWINKYLDHHEIKSKYIHFCKGDLHRYALERTEKFEYINYMSFAPASGWQQENFSTSYWGFSVEVIPKWNNEIDRKNVVFEFKKKKHNPTRV